MQTTSRSVTNVTPVYSAIYTFLLLCIGIQLPQHSAAQAPSTDIFVADIKTNPDGSYTFSKPVNITNREGYDNQPAFFPGGRIYYVSLRDSLGTDIYAYDPGNGKHIRITKTPESEYSPTLMPGKKSFSVVRVDRDSAQRLYQVTLDGKSNKLLLKYHDSVGYHCWMNEKKAALFVLGDSTTLQIADIMNQQSETVVSHIGRCIARIPGSEQISYVDKVSPGKWYIGAWHPATMKTAYLMKTLEGSEDYAWTPDRKLLMGKDGILYLSDPFKAMPWTRVADFSGTVGNFYRIVLNQDGTKIALVGYKGDKP